MSTRARSFVFAAGRLSAGGGKDTVQHYYSGTVTTNLLPAAYRPSPIALSRARLPVVFAHHHRRVTVSRPARPDFELLTFPSRVLQRVDMMEAHQFLGAGSFSLSGPFFSPSGEPEVAVCRGRCPRAWVRLTIESSELRRRAWRRRRYPRSGPGKR